MASNAAEREILFTELQVRGEGRRPSPAPLPSWRRGRRSRRAPPPPARRSARDAHPSPAQPSRGRGAGGSPCPPQASSRCSPPGAEAPPPGHGPTPPPAATRFCLSSAPSFPRRAAASLRRGLPGPRPRPRPRPRDLPPPAPGLPAPAAATGAGALALPSRGARRSAGPGPEGSWWPPHAPSGSGKEPLFPLDMAPRRSRSSFLLVGLERRAWEEEKMVRSTLFVTRQGFLSLQKNNPQRPRNSRGFHLCNLSGFGRLCNCYFSACQLQG